MFKVPVVNQKNEPLMPTTIFRAKRWVKSGRATPFFKMGIWCVRMNEEVGEVKQDIVVGIDPGSKREGFTVKSCSSTYLNIQTNAVTHIKDRLELRSQLRHKRRQRNSPYRKWRKNRAVLKKSRIAPSTKARWDFKINLVVKLTKIYPIAKIIIEDMKAIIKKGKPRWNKYFCPLQTGKNYAYEKLRKLGELILISGRETAKLREKFELVKSYEKLSDKFESHCIDSWVMANSICEGKLDNKKILRIIPLQLRRRQLHLCCPERGGKRRPNGSTRSLGIKRGSIAKHPKYGKCYVGGTSKGRISLHNLESGAVFCQNAKVEHCKIVCYNRTTISVVKG